MKEVVAYTVPVHNNLEILIVHFTKKKCKIFSCTIGHDCIIDYDQQLIKIKPPSAFYFQTQSYFVQAS